MTKYRSALVCLGIVAAGVGFLSLTDPYMRKPLAWALYLFVIPFAYSWLTFVFHRDKLISQRLQVWCTALFVFVVIALHLVAVYVFGDQWY